MAEFRAIHTVDLKPDVDREEFEKFMLIEFIPATVKLPGCLDVQLLKGYSGGRPGVAPAKSDKVWSDGGKHVNPERIEKLLAKLYTFAAAYWLIGGYTVVSK